MPSGGLRIRACAKINLGLAVGPRRGDGYHELATVYQTIDLADTLELRRRRGGHRLWCSDTAIPCGGRNLVMKALAALRPWLGRNRGVDVILRKRIPAGAGLGGGSSDAAAALIGVNALWNLKLTPAQLQGLAAGLGSDVPFFLHGGTALGLGRGEVICPLADWKKPQACVLAWPREGLSTAAVYAAFAGGGLTQKKNLRIIFTGLLKALARGEAAALELGNALEAPALRLRPELRNLKSAIGAKGWPAAMTGSGAAFYALAPSPAEARGAAAELQRKGFSAHAGRFTGRRLKRP